MRVLIAAYIIILSSLVHGQLVTSGGMTPNQLVKDVLLGEGVEVFNINYSGANEAIGTFNSTNANVGIDEGIIITTGTIYSNSEGPIGPNNNGQAGKDNGYGGYAPLTNLVGGSTYNAAVLEFDFIPYSDTVRFKYVFASEEYPEWVGSEFNDVFAFFISGPGISGGGKNMAIIPGTNDAVAINNVNSIKNQQYYINNGNGNQSPYNSNPSYIQYDGFTVPLEAVSAVECGEVYHLVIAIADVGDPDWDSGIFLEKNSLESVQPVQVSYHLLDDPYGDGQTMAQNCSSAEVIITRSGPMINQPLSIPITVLGDAIEGLDYSSIPSVIHFAPGETTKTFLIHALNNAALTGVVNLILQFEIEDPCGNAEFQVVELFIKPVEPVSVNLEDVEKKCVDDIVELIAEPFGGGGDYTYQWSTGETTESIFVNPLSTQTYTVSVTDECLNETATATATVIVPVLEPLVVHSTGDAVEDCPYLEHDLSVEAMGGSGDYVYEWIDGTGKSISVDPTIKVKPGTTTTYTVYVTDMCGEMDSSEVTITILSPPLLVSLLDEIEMCVGDSVLLTASSTGGFGDHYYYWPHSGETTQSVWIKADEATRIYVIVKDDCQTFQVQEYTEVSVVQPKADFEIVTEPLYIGLPITFENLSQGANSYFWNFGDGSTSTDVHPNNIYDEKDRYNVMLIAEDNNGCLDTIVKPIRILDEVYIYVPNSFTPDGKNENNTFSISTIGVVEFGIRIFNRWGQLVFESKDPDFVWDAYFGDTPVRDGTYIWKIDYTTVNDPDTQKMVGHVNVLR